jgi:RNA polymerase sigma factor (sigma-70 family)
MGMREIKGQAGGTLLPDDAVDPVVRALGDDLDTGFADMFGAYQGLVFTAALRLCGRWADAEDLTAEAFLRAYRALSGYEDERVAALRPRAWLIKILMNVWRNSRRTDARKPPPAPLDDAPDPVDPGEGVEAATVRHETGGELAELLSRLSEDQRTAVVLRHVVDLSIAEIAGVLDVPQGTVKSHISRGLHRLRALTTENLSSATPHPDPAAPDPISATSHVAPNGGAR